MAKSIRASAGKRNRAKLRTNVFAPVSEARTERLSAKLQEIASENKEQAEGKAQLNTTGTGGFTNIICCQIYMGRRS